MASRNHIERDAATSAARERMKSLQVLQTLSWNGKQERHKISIAVKTSLLALN